MDQITEAVVNEQPIHPDVQTTTLSSDQAKEAEVPKVDFKSLIPDAYKEEKALQNFQDMDGFVKSFLHRIGIFFIISKEFPDFLSCAPTHAL